MSGTIMVAYGVASVNDNLTRFVPICGALNTADTNSVEDDSEIPIRDAGTFDKLQVFVPAGNTATVTSTVTLRKSRVDTAVIISIGPDATGLFEDVVNSVAFAVTDEAALEITIPTEAGTNTLVISLVALRFTAAAGDSTIRPMAAAGGSNVNTASATRFWSNGGGLVSSGTEAFRQLKVFTPFTTSDLYAHIATGANLRTTATTVKTRKNGVDGGQSFSVGAGAAGAFEDTSGTDSLAVNDLYCIAHTTGTGTESCTFDIVSTTFISTLNAWIIMAEDGNSVNFNTTNYTGVEGNYSWTATEGNTQYVWRYGARSKLSNLQVYTSANTIATSATTVRTRVNGVDGGQSVSIAAGFTGLSVDSTGTDLITNGDKINYQVVTPNTSGAITNMTGAIHAEPLVSDTMSVYERNTNPVPFIQRAVPRWVNA